MADTFEVKEFHKRADKDGSPQALHHTLGSGPNQAAAGNHTHDGGGTTGLDYADISNTPGPTTWGSITGKPAFAPIPNPAVRSESGTLNHVYAGGVGPVASAIVFAVAFSAAPAIAIAANDYRLSLYYGGLAPGGVTINSRGFNGIAPPAATYSVSWTATGPI